MLQQCHLKYDANLIRCCQHPTKTLVLAISCQDFTLQRDGPQSICALRLMIWVCFKYEDTIRLIAAHCPIYS